MAKQREARRSCEGSLVCCCMGLILNLNYLPHWAGGLCNVQMLMDVFDSDNLGRLARLC